MATRSTVLRSIPRSKSAAIIRRLRAYRSQRPQSQKGIPFAVLPISGRRRGICNRLVKGEPR
jgi:hypothetical protein